MADVRMVRHSQIPQQHTSLVGPARRLGARSSPAYALRLLRNTVAPVVGAGYHEAMQPNPSATKVSLVLACIAVFVLQSISVARATECRDDPDVINQCFVVHGRLRADADGRIHLWPVGTTRLFAVEFRPKSPRALSTTAGGPYMPQTISTLLSSRATVFADFQVCPFTPDEPGKMRYVCIQSASQVLNLRP
jgi:hypothetical protein